jgi:hypothetical protein
VTLVFSFDFLPILLGNRIPVISRLRDSQLPRMSTNDAIARYFGLSRGDVSSIPEQAIGNYDVRETSFFFSLTIISLFCPKKSGCSHSSSE